MSDFTTAQAMTGNGGAFNASPEPRYSRVGGGGGGLRRALSASLLGLGLLVAHGAVQAQVQRSFVNLGFEDPLSFVTETCFGFLGQSQVPGWLTSHPPRLPGITCSGVITGLVDEPVIELWANNFLGIPARAGRIHAELNAYTPSRVYQSVCLVNGETIPWRLSHRGRDTAFNTYDVMEFKIAASTVARLSSSSGGTFLPPSSLGFGGSASGSAGPNGWTDYTGSFVYSGATGVVNFGFESISTANGDLAIGNFLDEIQVSLRPILEFSTATVTVQEGASVAFPLLNVSGTVPAGGITVPVTVSGTATSGSDFTAFTINYVIPAGTYLRQGFAPSTPNLVTTADTVVEDNETVVLTLTSTAAYLVSSLSTCGGAGRGGATITLQDNDVDLRATKSVSNATPIVGSNFTYTVTFTNNTAQPTIAPLTAHNVTAAVADAVPAGLTFSSWTCAASGGATCPAAAGSGAISGNAVLPAGAGGAAGGSVTYTIQAVASAPAVCGSTITNTATITVPAGFQEGSSAQAGFVTPAPGGSANNTASVNVQVNCLADLAITKTNNLPGTVDLPNDTLARGQTTVYRLVVTNNGPSPVTGAVVRDTATGLTCTGLTCSSSPVGACPAAPTAAQLLSGTGVTLQALPVGGSVSLDLSCTVN